MRLGFRCSVGVLVMCCAAVAAAAQRLPEPVTFLAGGSASRSAGMQINPDATRKLRESTGTVSLMGVPLITGQSANFTMQPVQVFSGNATLWSVNADGTTTPLALPATHAWSGADPTDSSRVMFVSANEKSQLRAMIISDSQTSVTVIAPDSSQPGSDYSIRPAALPKIPMCSELPDQACGLPSDQADGTISHQARSTTLYDIELMTDVSNDLYKQLKSDDAVVMDYLVDLYGAVNTIYRRDLQAQFVVVNLAIWHVPDGFSAQHPEDKLPGSSQPNPALTTGDQLYNYRDFTNANRSAAHFDLSQLLDSKDDLGGLAYMDVLSSDFQNSPKYRTSVCNVYGTDDFPGNINTYYWDTMVTAHELGHNVGSPHTHCYTPPIDCCATEACSTCGTASASAGTIMSYCHLWLNSGGSMQMVFHPRCIDKMRPKIETSPILSPHVAQAALQVYGVQSLAAFPNSEPSKATTLVSRQVNGPTITQTFTIVNSGDIATNLSGTPPVAISGSPYLTVTAQPGKTTLAPGESSTFAVQFNPQSWTPQNAQISIPATGIGTFVLKIAGVITPMSAPSTGTFTGSQPINQNTGSYTEIPITIAGVPGRVSDVQVKINGSNCLDPAQTGIQHPYVGDLEMVLESPGGTQVVLMDSPGAGTYGAAGANFCNTLFSDAPGNPAIESITAAGAPYSGTYQPDEPFSRFLGELPNGTWKILVYDAASPDTGIVHSISVIVRGEAQTDVSDWPLYGEQR